MKIKLKTPLHKHQVNELRFHLGKGRSASWDEMGVGKTLIALAKLRILYNLRLIENILVVCPLSVLETWSSEIEKHTTFTYTKLTGSLENKVKLLHNNTPIFLISYDSIPGRKKTLGILFGALIAKGIDFIILDEATYIKNYNALRTQTLTKLCDIVGRTLFLSGTPIANKPEDVITVYRAMDGGNTFGKNFFSARNRYFENHGYGFPDWHLRKDKEEEFRNRLFLNATRILKSECLDLPDKIFTERYADLTAEQTALYVPVAQEILHELRLPAGRVKIQNTLVKLAKLSQIANGFIYTDKDVQSFVSNPKLELLQEVIHEVPEGEKIIVFAKWRQDLANIERILTDNGMHFVSISGSTHDRSTPINSFNKVDNVKVLVSQITAGAYGLNLVAANYMIYYSMGFSINEWLQSQDRIHRIGQTKNCVYISLLCRNTVDSYIYKSLKEGVEISKSLINEKSILRLKENLQVLCKE